MRVTKEVQPTSLLSSKTAFHCFIMSLTGETFLLLSMAQSNLSSPILTVRKSFLGNKENPSYLCMKRKVGWWISLVWGRWQVSSLDISLQNFVLSKSCKAKSMSTTHCALNHRSSLNYFKGTEKSFPNYLNVTSESVVCIVHKNSAVKSLDPSSLSVFINANRIWRILQAHRIPL